MVTEPVSFEKFNQADGVYLLSEINNKFEETYLKVRQKEKRIYTDEEVNSLPFASESNPHRNEWKLREKSYLRFKDYLASKKENLTILDLGCGNCWFCGQLSKSFNHSFYCVDVNLSELKQAARVFKSENIKFIYADIFTSDIYNNSFDLVTINAAVQYFSDLKKLLEKLLTLINQNGEIHIIDSPFYADDEIENAKERTRVYYESIAFPEMGKKYFHHTFAELNEFNYKFLYKPSPQKINLAKLFKAKDSPFPWILVNR
jgi:ubiquinone/menaquinone biosynthesis C-methylase UbiE